MSLWKDRVGGTGRWQVTMADVIMPFCSQICFLNLQYTLDILIYTYMYDIHANLTKVWVSTFNSDFLPDFFHRPPFGDGFNHVLLLLLFLVNDPI